MSEHYQKMAPGMFLIPKEGQMKVPGLIIASDELMADIKEDKSLDQVRRVAELEGIVGYSVAMPDIHWGYGFPIGGVAATCAETGVISPGGVGYDINCGVRLAIIDTPFDTLSQKKKDELLAAIYAFVPSGVGHGHKKKRALSEIDYQAIGAKGSLWSVEMGYGLQEDIAHTESLGVLENADMSSVSHTAKERGKDQLGTIGSGNHFVEIGKVDKIFDDKVAASWGVKPGQIYILIHSGSRGFGHQVCQDFLDSFIKQGFAKDISDKQLVAAPIQSSYGKAYLQAMSAAANYAFNNRQQILHAVRLAFQQVCNIPPDAVRMIYDVCHNIAKFEEHEVDGKKKKLCVHRKGATRAYGAAAKELPAIYQATGQPVLVPGDMGRASHLMVGKGNTLTWCSACHGAGRKRSRIQSAKSWKGKDLVGHMASQGVHVMACSPRTIAEEMPDAYKNVDEVVAAVQLAGLANMVARLRPHLVIKG
jgi:tRNA-splicing ligase RtcB